MKKQLLLTLLAITPIATTSCANWSYSTNLENCIKQQVKQNYLNTTSTIYFTFNHCDLIKETEVSNYKYFYISEEKEYTGKRNIYYIDYSYILLSSDTLSNTQYKYQGYIEYLVNADYCIWMH